MPVWSLSARHYIARSAGHEALVSGAIKIPGDVPVIDPDEIAGRVWELTRDRTEVEAVMP